MRDLDDVLIPFARHTADGWDSPWPGLIDHSHPVARFDSEGFLVDWTLPLESQTERQRLAAPTRWYVYAIPPAATPTAVSASALVIVGSHCLNFWGLLTTPEPTPGQEGTDPRRSPYRRFYAAFSRPPDSVLEESEIPNLAQIRVDLGLVDNVLPPPCERFPWPADLECDFKSMRTIESLGYFRFGSQVLGVLYDQRYEGESYAVLAIEEDRGRIPVYVHGG